MGDIVNAATTAQVSAIVANTRGGLILTLLYSLLTFEEPSSCRWGMCLSLWFYYSMSLEYCHVVCTCVPLAFQVKPEPSPEPDFEENVIVLNKRTGRGLGFSIAGGIDNNHKPGDNRVYCTKVLPNGVAMEDGRLRLVTPQTASARFSCPF